MYHPLLSIITSTYNSGETLKETIHSILGQTYKNIEYIIIDGGSNDSTIDIIKSSENVFKNKNIHFKWISEPDKGIYDAWNKALKFVQGEWVVFIGSDDYLKSEFTFENLLSSLKIAKEKKINYVYGKIEHITQNKEVIEITGKPWHVQKGKFSDIMNLPHSGCFNHINLFKNHGEFNSNFKIAGDYEFLLRELKKTENEAYFVDEICLVMREGGVSGTLKNRLTVVKENYKARKLNGIKRFSKELFFWNLRVRFIILITKIFGDNSAAKLADLYRKIILGKEKRWSS